MAFYRDKTTSIKLEDIEYYNPRLKSFVMEGGRIVPSRITGVSAPQQRRLKQAIERARFLALLPYCDMHE